MVELLTNSPNAHLFLTSWVEELQSAFRQEVNLINNPQSFNLAMKIASNSILYECYSYPKISYYQVLQLKPLYDDFIRFYMEKTQPVPGIPNPILENYKVINTPMGEIVIKNLNDVIPER